MYANHNDITTYLYIIFMFGVRECFFVLNWHKTIYFIFKNKIAQSVYSRIVSTQISDFHPENIFYQIMLREFQLLVVHLCNIIYKLYNKISGHHLYSHVHKLEAQGKLFYVH